MVEKPIRDPLLTPEEYEIVARLTESDLQEIDKLLMSNASRHWQKVAMVVGQTMMDLRTRYENISDIFYPQRVRKLVKEGKLESQGNMAYMRFSEVRIATREFVAKSKNN